MKVITDIKPQVKNGKRVSIYLDGAFYCGLDLLTVLKNRIKVGDEISEQKLIDIQKESELSSAFDKALKQIERSYKTQKAVKDKLLKLGYLEEIVDEVIKKLKNYCFLDDKNYAERYVLTYSGYKGKRLIKSELKFKGVSEDLIDGALNNIESELEVAIKLAEKYSKNKEKDKKNFVKCYKHLISKGFNYDDSMTATKKAFENLDID